MIWGKAKGENKIKKFKLVKMMAIVMSIVMMLSASVFAAENEENDGISLASDFAYVDGTISDTFTMYYTGGLFGKMYYDLTASCNYTVAISYESGYAYIYDADFVDVIDLSEHGYDNYLRLENTVDNGDSWYADYLLDGKTEGVRIWITCDSLGNASLSAVKI